MKTILIIALIAMVMTGLAVADPVDMSIYDRNQDMLIDAEERVILDIDIENSRVTTEEARIIDSYTIDGSIILNEEFQAAFLNPVVQPRTEIPEVTIVEEPKAPVNAPVNAPQIDTEPIVKGNVTGGIPEDDVGSNMTLIFVIGMLTIAGIILYMYSRQNKEE